MSENKTLIGSLTRLYHNEHYPQVNEELLDQFIRDNKITEIDKIMIMAGVENYGGEK